MVGGKSIGFDTGTGIDVILRRLLDGLCIYVLNDLHERVSGSIFTEVHTHHDRSLPRRSPSSLSTLLGAEVALVELDETRKLVEGVPLGHGTAYLVGDEPGTLVGYADKPCRSQDGHPDLLIRHEEDHEEPRPKRCLGILHDGPRGEGRLIMAGTALIEVPGGYVVVSPISTAGAGETVRPAPVEEVVPAVFLGLETIYELNKVCESLISAVSHVFCPPAHSLAGGCDNILWVTEMME